MSPLVLIYHTWKVKIFLFLGEDKWKVAELAYEGTHYWSQGEVGQPVEAGGHEQGLEGDEEGHKKDGNIGVPAKELLDVFPLWSQCNLRVDELDKNQRLYGTDLRKLDKKIVVSS